MLSSASSSWLVTLSHKVRALAQAPPHIDPQQRGTGRLSQCACSARAVDVQQPRAAADRQIPAVLGRDGGE